MIIYIGLKTETNQIKNLMISDIALGMWLHIE